MRLSGIIAKMQTSLVGNNAHYSLQVGKKLLDMNALIGQKLELKFGGVITCVNCGALTKKSYSQGFCYPCCKNLARCDLCIMRPETCHHHLGTCLEPKWGLANCFVPHIVYLANSSGLKVGISRQTNIPYRWIDQGAIKAIPILRVNTRLKSGLIEHSLKQWVNDKTNWRKMLKNETPEVDLLLKKQELLSNIQELIIATNAQVLKDNLQKINYPVAAYPTKVTALNFDKTSIIAGTLKGIKAQYLIFDNGVLNIRKFNSYHLEITIS